MYIYRRLEGIYLSYRSSDMERSDAMGLEQYPDTEMRLDSSEAEPP